MTSAHFGFDLNNPRRNQLVPAVLMHKGECIFFLLGEILHASAELHNFYKDPAAAIAKSAED